MTSSRLSSASLPLILGTLLFACSSSSTGTTTTTTKDGGTTSAKDASGDAGVKLGAVGDDCSSDAMCASGLCDNNGFCATPVKAIDGGKCTVDADCPTGDSCNVATGDCFSPAKDNTGVKSCTTNADCPSDETCSAAKICAG